MKKIGTVASVLLAAFIYGGHVFAGSEGNSNTFFGTNAGASTAGDDDEGTFVGFEPGQATAQGEPIPSSAIALDETTPKGQATPSSVRMRA